jgi:hypothetical protein
MANVLSDERKQQVLAFGRRGWSLRRIEQATGIRRETYRHVFEKIVDHGPTYQ